MGGLLKIAEAAERLGVTPRQLRGLVAAGFIPKVVIGLGAQRPNYRIESADIDRYILDSKERALAVGQTDYRRRIPVVCDDIDPGALRETLPRELLKLEETSTSFVYFMRAGSVCKIGVSKNVLARARLIQTSREERIEVLCSIKGGRRTETYLHQRFSEQRLNGEWFIYPGPVAGLLNAYRKVPL